MPTVSPSLIKIQPIVSEILAVKAKQTHTYTNRQTDTHTHTDKVCRSHSPQTETKV